MKTVKRFLSHPLTLLGLRVGLGVVFVVASADKIQNPDLFARNIANYRLLPYVTINGIAIVLPWLEMIAGILLIAGVWTRANALLASAMLAIFIFAVSQALWRNLDISCGCFSTDPAAHKMTMWTLYWDIIWLLWGIIVMTLDREGYSLVKVLWKKE